MARMDEVVTPADRRRAIDLAGARAVAGTVVAVVHDIGTRERDGHRRLLVARQPSNGDAEVIVTDLDSDTVAAASVGGHFQLSAAERTRAERIASEDQNVIAFLADRPMNPLTRLSFPPSVLGGDSTQRVAIVFLRPAPGARSFAFVDLTKDQVVAVTSRDRG